jgi:hypothetical protein
MDIIMTGTSDQEVDLVKFSMEAQSGSWVPILNDNVCGTGLECPVQATGEWTMKYSLEVDNAFPNGEIETKWKLVGNDGADELACALVILNII